VPYSTFTHSGNRGNSMTIDEFGEMLCALTVGEWCSLPLDVYELLFPPGEPNDGARGKAYVFARAHGCEIKNPIVGGQPLEVVFIKCVTNPPACP
jgi:hypothetical protein